MRGMPGRAGLSDIVEQRQNEEPHDIYKVPVEGDIVQGDVASRSEAASEKLAQEAPQNEENSDGYMEAMEAGNHKEARAINAARVEPETFMVEMPPFVALEADEQGAESDRNKEPTESGLSFLHGHLPHVKGATAENEKDRVDRSEQERKVGDILGWRPGVACLPGESILRPAEHKVTAKKTSEEHALGYQEHDHAELGRLWRCTVMFVGIVCKGCCGHGWFLFKKESRICHWAAKIHQYQNQRAEGNSKKPKECHDDCVA